MNTEIIKVDEKEWQEELLKRSGDIIKNGGLVAFPTETVYGLGGDAFNVLSSQKIYQAKGRPSDNPLIIHISKWDDIYEIAKVVPEHARKLADAFWPGPLTMILPKGKRVPYETTGGLDTVAVRMPSHIIAQKLIGYSGGFVAAPSANTSGKPSPTVAKYVIEDLSGHVDMILDGGEVGIGIESTIIDLTGEIPQILRPGYITLEMLQEVLGDVEVDSATMEPSSGQAPKAPGMKYKHYAPKGELSIILGGSEEVVRFINQQAVSASKQEEKVGVIATRELMSHYQADVVKCIGSRGNEAEIAKSLYRILREFDDENVTRIYSESFESEGIGQAIMNRLLKASGYKVIKLGEHGGKANDSNRK